MTIPEKLTIGVLGAGAMGSGIAQLAASAGHETWVLDNRAEALRSSRAGLEKIFDRLIEKGRLDQRSRMAILERLHYTEDLDDLKSCGAVIEAVVEELPAKRSLFARLEKTVGGGCLLASNTSSLSITSIGSACEMPQRVVGLHFFNPAPLMALVEVVPGILTSPAVAARAKALAESFGKTAVAVKDTPGFIVNRVARPFYGESLRVLEEGIADPATIDWAMREIGRFRMGPFELMDLIGNDVNYAVTESVFKEFYFDPRYKPSLTQKRMVEAGLLGRKSRRGYYDYRDGAPVPEPNPNHDLGGRIVDRVVTMLINEAIDAVFLGVASASDIDLAMTLGVNYPQGLLRWGQETGLKEVLRRMVALQEEFGEDRYRPSPLLRRMARTAGSFF